VGPYEGAHPVYDGAILGAPVRVALEKLQQEPAVHGAKVWQRRLGLTPGSPAGHILGMTARWFRHLLAAAAVWMAFPGAAAASHLDGAVRDFEQGDGTGFFESFCQHALPCSETSPPLTTFATSTFSGKYLGTFGEETLSFFGLDVLDIMALFRDRAYLSFDLIMTGAWFGSEDPADPGFETLFKVIANGKTLFDSAVDNNFPPSPATSI
jgi:hypothetical protein